MDLRLLFATLLLSAAALLQSPAMLVAQAPDISAKIGGQYPSKIYQSFLYEAVPHLKEIEDGPAQREAESKRYWESPKMVETARLDTSWSFQETKSAGDSVYTPFRYGHNFDTGTDNESISHSNYYLYVADSSRFYPQSLRKNYFNDQFRDSSVAYYFNPPDTAAASGDRFRYLQSSPDGADSDYYHDLYRPDQGWFLYQRQQRFRDENNADTLQKYFTYIDDLGDYYLSRQSRFLRFDSYELNETKTWNYNTEVSLTGWSRYLTMYDDQQRLDYEVSKIWDQGSEQLIGRDSLNVIYEPNYIEGWLYRWEQSERVWQIENMSRTFESSSNNPDEEVHVDSVITYQMRYLEAEDSYEIDEPIGRTEFDYDADGNPSEQRIYRLGTGSLYLFSRTEREWAFIDNRFINVKQDFYRRSNEGSPLYRTSSAEFLYENGEYRGNSFYSFNVEGDTTRGVLNLIEQDEDFNRIIYRYEWDSTLGEMALKNYRISKRYRYDDGRIISHNYTIEPDGTASRSFNLFGSYPAVMNDGPINIALGDTVSLVLSARNPDMSIPNVEVTNMPESASYDPESRHFYWIVDDLSVGPMTYTARRGALSTALEVEFITGGIGVSNAEETADRPTRFALHQNYPNPFNPSTTIEVTMAESGTLRLDLYNLLGQNVRTIYSGRLTAGTHRFLLNANGLASGVYLYRMQAGSHQFTRKMTLIE